MSISISGLRIGHISISQECMTSIHLTNCWIGGITFKNDGTADDRGPNVSIYGCLIGSFNASSGGRIGDVNIFDSSIQQFKTPLPKQNNPFSGDVNFKNVSLIPFHGIKEFKDLQIYRNLYAHLESNNNFQTSKYIRSLEKRLERTSEESLINKSINYLYDAISFYNYYPDRPLKITAMLFVFMVYISFVFDLTIINNGFDHLDKWFFVGNNTLLNDLFRSFYFSVTSIINPVGVILGKSIVIGKYFFVQLAFSLYGLFNLLLVTISFFGFKKKFNET